MNKKKVKPKWEVKYVPDENGKWRDVFGNKFSLRWVTYKKNKPLQP